MQLCHAGIAVMSSLPDKGLGSTASSLLPMHQEEDAACNKVLII